MKRREFIGLIGAAAAWPIAARAEDRALATVAVLAIGPPASPGYRAGFPRGLREAGYQDGENIGIEEHVAPYETLLPILNDLIGRKPAVIFAAGNVNIAQATKAATSSIPIIFANGGDPVGTGLVPRLNRPGGNVTGVSFAGVTVTTKRLELLHELVPQARTVAILVNPANLIAENDVRTIQDAARSLGIRTMVANASTAQQLDAAFSEIARLPADAMITSTDAFFASRRTQITALAARYRIPAIYPGTAQVEAGGLMSYSDDRADSYRQAGLYVGRILKGDKPADLPVLQPSKFELVVNLKAAKEIGLVVSECFSCELTRSSSEGFGAAGANDDHCSAVSTVTPTLTW